jgi:hypothetical protein
VDDIVSSITDDSLPKYTYDPITQRYTLDTSSVKKKEDDSGAVSDGGPGDAPFGGGPGGGIPGGGTGNTNPGFFSTVMNVVAGLMGKSTTPNFNVVPVESRGTYAGKNPGISDYAALDPGALHDQAAIDAEAAAAAAQDVAAAQAYADATHSEPSESQTHSEAQASYDSGHSEPSEAQARGGLNLNGRYYPPKYAQGGLSALARGGIPNLGDYSDGGRLLRGPGDGVSDGIPAIIANKQPARLADGEFVVPARIVSELGNGSTEAGARKLYQMLARVQNARKKSIGQGRVAVNSRSDKMLPA